MDKNAELELFMYIHIHDDLDHLINHERQEFYTCLIKSQGFSHLHRNYIILSMKILFVSLKISEWQKAFRN